jgi:hypothetical protein
MGFAPPPGEIDAQPIVVAFNRKGVRLALQMALMGKDQTVGVPEVRAEGDVGGVRKLRSQAAGRFGSTIPSVQPQIFLVARSIAHHSQQAVFFGQRKSRVRRLPPTPLRPA